MMGRQFREVEWLPMIIESLHIPVLYTFTTLILSTLIRFNFCNRYLDQRICGKYSNYREIYS